MYSNFYNAIALGSKTYPLNYYDKCSSHVKRKFVTKRVILPVGTYKGQTSTRLSVEATQTYDSNHDAMLGSSAGRIFGAAPSMTMLEELRYRDTSTGTW